MTEFPSLRRLNVSYTLVHVVYWAMFAIFAGYQTSLLLGRGFTSGEAGIFASIRCFAGILAQPLLGGWADRHPEVPIKRLLNACLVLALGVNVVFYTTRPGFWGTALGCGFRSLRCLIGLCCLRGLCRLGCCCGQIQPAVAAAGPGPEGPQGRDGRRKLERHRLSPCRG